MRKEGKKENKKAEKDSGQLGGELRRITGRSLPDVRKRGRRGSKTGGKEEIG